MGSAFGGDLRKSPETIARLLSALIIDALAGRILLADVDGRLQHTAYAFNRTSSDITSSIP